MIKKIKVGLLMGLATQCYAAQPQLEGFTYGKQDAPSGKEWESPEYLAHNKEQPRSTFYSFADVDSARRGLESPSQCALPGAHRKSPLPKHRKRACKCSV